MTDIVTPFVSGEAFSSSARAKCIAIAEFWLGSGVTYGVSTWDDFHTLINPVLTALGITNISDGDTGQQWLDRMNLANIAMQETVDLIARFTTPPTGGRAVPIENLYRALDTAGVLAKLDALYVMAAADAQAAQRNWIADAYNLTPNNSPTFEVDVGYTGNGTNQSLGTGFNPATAVAPKYVRDSATIGAWSLTDLDANAALIGVGSGAGVFVVPRTGGNVSYRINDNTSSTIAVADSVGLFAASRATSGVKRAYKNGAELATASVTSVAVSNAEIILLGGAGTLTTRQMSAAFFGADLTTADHLAMHEALSDYFFT